MSVRGAALASVSGVVVVEQSDGPANDSTSESCTPSTRFQVSSVSKRFVAASALLLAERDVLDLNEPISRFISPCPDAWRDITMHHLLSHTAGLGHWADLPGFDLADPLGARALLDLIADRPLLSAPGTQWRYSGPGFVLAARIVESATGVSYHAFVASEIFGTLGMAATTSGINPSGPGVALGHRSSGEVGVVPGFEKLPGTGDVWSTVEDLDRFTRSLHAGRLLTEESVAAMVNVQASGGAHDDEPGDELVRVVGYGYGHFIGRHGDEPVWFHPGDNPGYVSWLGWLPEREASIAVLGNDERRPIEPTLAECVAAVSAATQRRRP